MGLGFEHCKAGAQNFHVSTKFIDDKSLYPRTLVRFQQCDRAVQLRENAAAVDVAHQQHRRIDELRQAHIDDVVSF